LVDARSGNGKKHQSERIFRVSVASRIVKADEMCFRPLQVTAASAACWMPLRRVVKPNLLRWRGLLGSMSASRSRAPRSRVTAQCGQLLPFDLFNCMTQS